MYAIACTLVCGGSITRGNVYEKGKGREGSRTAVRPGINEEDFRG